MTNNTFKTEVIKQHPRLPARVTKISTAHGDILTPAFMPVGTRAAVNCMNPFELEHAGSQIILGGNTYHMLVTPGLEFIEAAGGMHKMMAWNKPMLTDSGGYQVFSLSRNSKICKINEIGAKFKHSGTGKVIDLNPKTSIEAQKVIGADIIMAFDQCTPETGEREVAVLAMERTHRWLLESIAQHHEQPDTVYGHSQALFGIIQGGSYRDLREQSAEFILAQNLDGIAIGGESIGYDMALTKDILSWIVPSLPKNKSRYTMGVGLVPQDLIDVVAGGIDMFDCVAPTRNARHGSLFHGHAVIDEDWVQFDSTYNRGRLLIKKSEFSRDNSPILEGCDCYTCQNFSRAYLHYLYKEKQNLFLPLATTHNIRVMHKTCEVMRDLILNGR
jgi:queuine tRNA-ribosyltransferase